MSLEVDLLRKWTLPFGRSEYHEFGGGSFEKVDLIQLLEGFESGDALDEFDDELDDDNRFADHLREAHVVLRKLGREYEGRV